MRAHLAVIAVIVALPGSALADRVKVAVVPGIAVNLDASRVDALSQDLADALSTELEVDAVGGLEIRRLLPADGIPPDCVATPACVTDVAKRTGASQLLFVVMVDTGTGGAIQVDTTWVDPASGKTASRPAVDIASVGDAKARFSSVAHQLLPDATIKPKPTAGPVGTMAPEVPRHFTTNAKIAAAVSVVGLGVGIGFGLSARSKYNACEATIATCTQDKRDSIRSTDLLADVGFLIAVGGAIATSVMFATSGSEAHLVVEPTPTGVGVAAFGRF